MDQEVKEDEVEVEETNKSKTLNIRRDDEDHYTRGNQVTGRRSFESSRGNQVKENKNENKVYSINIRL